jgi:hypothetical protein
MTTHAPTTSFGLRYHCLALLLGAVCLMASACSPLGSLQPLGEKAVVLKPEEINGDWVSNGGHLKMLVTDATNGTALVAWIEEHDNDLKMKRLKLVVRQTDETTFINVRFLDETNEVYMIGRGKLSDNTLLFWPGDKDALKKAVKQGKFSITETNDADIIVSTNFQQAAEFLASPAGKAMFDFEEPIVLTRMPR